jgi:hypothetical protein
VKHFIAVILAAAALAAIVASAPVQAATPADKRVAVLEQQVKALQAQVKALKKQVTVVRQTVDSNQEEFQKEASRNRIGDACMALAVADVFQSTWGSTFGPQQQLDDVSCKAIGITRPGIQANPTVSVFWGLTGWLIG